jgi:potassium channel LctB
VNLLVLLTFVCLSIWVMFKSLLQLLNTKRFACPVFSWRHFFVLLLAYLICILGFTVLYLGLEIAGYSSVIIYNLNEELSPVTYVGNLIYFSTMTMLSVGYGDITPLGLAKLLASIQALIGYLLPAAFIVSGFATTIGFNKEGNREFFND